MLSLQLETYRSSAAFEACPFSETETNICLASLSAMVIGPSNRREYCSNDNYDNCPIFLAKSLRRR
jgi:hypothetical protein